MERPDGMIIDRDMVSSRHDFGEDVGCDQYIDPQPFRTYEFTPLRNRM